MAKNIEGIEEELARYDEKARNKLLKELANKRGIDGELLCQYYEEFDGDIQKAFIETVRQTRKQETLHRAITKKEAQLLQNHIKELSKKQQKENAARDER